MNDTHPGQEGARGSPAAAARDLAPLALRRVGELLDGEETDGRLLIQAARLVLWAARLDDAGDDAESGGFELRFTGGADGDA